MSMGIPNARMLFWSVLSSGLSLLFVAPAPGYAQGNYLLAPNDLVAVTVFQEDDLATKSRVGNDGTISVPLIGTV